ncbi:MAG: phage capsid protein, partial [Thermoleophilia bacterium]|nr:phage capsid protein [Thermoleophilia bacterium]
MLRDIAVDAWYSGDRQRLTKVYERDERRQDGRRRLWSRRPEPGRRDRRMHVPLAGDIASTSASLLFSEPPAFTCSGTDAQARLAALLDEGGAVMTLLDAAEVCAALGGVYLRATWDASLARRPLLTV